ncbi:hypothetical protein C8J57DRAFT_1405399 [Mycena rebaudengoi]|nr:hypothetical protein C8J57DRAFT_1405399 [Mycena rebaudengoi]
MPPTIPAVLALVCSPNLCSSRSSWPADHDIDSSYCCGCGWRQEIQKVRTFDSACQAHCAVANSHPTFTPRSYGHRLGTRQRSSTGSALACV